MEEQRHLVGHSVTGAEDLWSPVAFLLPWTHFSFLQLRKRNPKRLRFRKFGEDQPELRKGLAIFLANIIHLLQMSDSVSQPHPTERVTCSSPHRTPNRGRHDRDRSWQSHWASCRERDRDGKWLTWLRIKRVHTWAERSWDNHWIHAPEDGIHFKDRFRPSDASMAPGVTENHPRNVPSLQLYLQYGNFGNRLKGQWE